MFPLIVFSILLFVITTVQAATILRFGFEGSNPWSGMTGYSTGEGNITTGPTWTTAGTIKTYGGSTSSGGMQRVVNSTSAAGNWTAGINSGSLAVVNSQTNLGLLTLSFSLSASSAYPVRVRIESYSSPSLRAGGRSALIYPAAGDFYQRYALDLDKMTPDGEGAFNPTNAYVKLSFELDSTAGWPAASAHMLKLENVNYSTLKYYVKPASIGGSDTNNGLNVATALATVQAAVNKPLTGDNIIAIMEDGTPGGDDYNPLSRTRMEQIRQELEARRGRL